MTDELPILCALQGELRGARAFEDAARAVVGAALRIGADALAGSPYAGAGEIVRGMVHLRPEPGTRRIWVAEPEPFALDEPGGAPALRPLPAQHGYLPSATALRWVLEHGAALSIDVEAGLLHPHRAGPHAPSSSIPLGSRETSERLLGRDATHVHVVPLLAPGRVVQGTLSIEARCRPAMGRPFVWEGCAAALGLVADLAAPALLGLPFEPAPPSLLAELGAPPGPGSAPDDLLPVIGPSTARLYEVAGVFAQQEETIFLRGPTGTGKTRLARWCHARSLRRAGPFVALDLLALPEELRAGELFGWRRGAFTGALRDNPGAVARAEQGTLFIDEIDKLSLEAQAGLLRLLEERLYRSAGDATGDRRADVRFLASANVDLAAAVRAGRFREDLYYRVNVLSVALSPLDERRDEIPAWAAYMLARRHREGGGRGEPRLAVGAAARLAAARWPGNLRQLDNVIRRAYALALVDLGPRPAALVIEPAHVERALAHESPAGPTPLLAELRRAAAAFVREAERRGAAGAPLSLDHAGAFAGLVIAAAVEHAGSREGAFRLLGRPDLLKNRNHHRALQREIKRAQALLGALGEEGSGELAAGDDEQD